MIDTKKVLIWALLGVLYSTLILPFSPYLFHFVSSVAVLHAIYYAVIFGLIGIVIQWLPRVPYLRFDLIFCFLIGCHLFVWLYGWSILGDLGFYLSVLLPLGISYGAVFLGAAIHTFLRDRVPSFPLDPKLLLGGLLVGVIGLKLGIVLYVYSTKSIIVSSRTAYRLQVNHPEETYSLPYPFTLSMKEGIDRFGFFLPEPTSEDTILIVVLDALRSDYLGRTMYGVPVTPNLDRLAGQGEELDRYYVQATWTKPSTASLFTGRYVREHGVMTGGRIRRGEYKGHVLPSDFRTLAERLEAIGYRNYGSVMTSHIGNRYQFGQGFELWFDPNHGYTGDSSSLERALFWLLREQPEKSFLYLHLHGPHHPYRMAYYNRAFLSRTPYFYRGTVNPPGRFTFSSPQLAKKIKNGTIDLTEAEVRYLRMLYAAQLNLYDRRLVAPFLNSLKTLGLLRESFLVVGGDHGEELYEHESYAHGNNLYEPTINPGMVVKFPKSQPIPKHLGSTTVESIDLTASLLDYAGGNHEALTGRSFFRDVSHESFGYAVTEQTRNGWIEAGAVVNNPMKLIHSFLNDREELYNLRSDPGETSNLIGTESDPDGLRDRLFEVVGSDSGPERSSVPLREISEGEMENLRGLGYVE